MYASLAIVTFAELASKSPLADLAYSEAVLPVVESVSLALAVVLVKFNALLIVMSPLASK